MAYTKPQVLVFQEFELAASETTDPLRAHISGGNADLHRYSVTDEKANIGLGDYDASAETCYSWPGREAGSVVDLDYVKLYMDDALLRYYENNIGVGGTVLPISGHANRVRADGVGFKANGTTYPRTRP